MNADDIIQRIQSAFPDAQVRPDGADCNFSVLVVSQAFEGKSPLQRQKPILALFREEITSGALHALSITARTPGETR